MKKENERKFLVLGINKDILEKGADIVQGYLGREPPVRVRIEDGREGYLTIKLGKGRIRSEFEYGIPLYEAEALLLAANKSFFIRKTRYKIGCLAVDVFGERLEGLIMIEIEAGIDGCSGDEEIPPYITAREVTGDERFENHNLAKLKTLPESWRCKDGPGNP